jgi:predicted dithiol-disulfide oxidoreductase (DUF899 family)
MTSDESNPRTGLPQVVDRATYEAEREALLAREKAHTHESDAIAAARRRLPMVEIDPTAELIGPGGPLTLLDAFEGRRQLVTYFHMWFEGRPAPEQCEGCTFFNGQVRELSHLHSRDVTYAALCQGPYEESLRYRNFMGWEMPWYSAQDSLDSLLGERNDGKFHLLCYLRDGERVFETYSLKGRGVEVLDNTYALMDLTAYGRQEEWEDSPDGWPLRSAVNDAGRMRSDGRPISQWPRIKAGRSDDLSVIES